MEIPVEIPEMKGRKLIKQILFDSWVECVQTDYVRQRINSERSIQASYWAQLNRRLTHNRRLFIEPRVALHRNGKPKKLIPDLVICNSRNVIAVVELKYLPRAKPRIDKDFESLAFLSKHRDQLSISNRRYRGPVVDDRDYAFGSRIVFAWAGIHRPIDPEEERALGSEIPELNGCLFRLHAVTQALDDPAIYSYE